MEKRMFSFEKLNFWNELRSFIKLIYRITKKFPEDEKFGLVSQMRRAAISVSSNIEEGSSRSSSKDQARFSHFIFKSDESFKSDNRLKRFGLY